VRAQISQQRKLLLPHERVALVGTFGCQMTTRIVVPAAVVQLIQEACLLHKTPKRRSY
jgi:hypothetical protein